MTQRMSRFLPTPSETLPRGPIESATNWIAHRGLRDGDLILIDAPVCVPRTGGNEPSIFLCDYPEYLRRARDPVVPLRLSSALRKKLIDQIGPASAWNPLLRTLGTVQPTAGHDEIEVLALFRSRPESPVANWKIELLGEAKAQRFGPESQQAGYLGDLLMDLTLAETAATAEEKKSQIDWITKQYTDPDGYKWNSVASVVRAQDNLQDGVYGFWPVLIAILHMWPNRFPLSPQEMNVLLEDFDKTFSEKWKENQEKLEPLGFFRFTEQAAASMRQNVESLKIQPSPFVPAQTAASPQFHP
jgi:hypothetical protein